MEPSSFPTIFTPPRNEEEAIDWLCLLRSKRIGPATFFRLIEKFGDARSALAELPKIAESAGISGYQPFQRGDALREMQAADFAGAHMLHYGAENYPKALECIAAPPPLLWAIGDLQTLRKPSCAVIGARNASSLGMRMASAIAKGLGQAGFIVVSGLARGIDTRAHTTALPTGTIAVMPGGVDAIYPAENAALAQEIGETGLRLSAQPMGMRPTNRHFPRRNWLIAALSQAVAVVEAATKSGSLITARDALDIGREVLAVPGHPFDARAAGCNQLLRDGATMIRGPRDCVAALTPNGKEGSLKQNEPISDTNITPPIRRDAQDIGRMILERLSPSPIAADQLIRDITGSTQEVSAALTQLELRGQIERQAGGFLALCDAPQDSMGAFGR